jgi:hypothetical protein
MALLMISTEKAQTPELKVSLNRQRGIASWGLGCEQRFLGA